MSKWIRFSDRLPEKGQLIWIGETDSDIYWAYSLNNTYCFIFAHNDRVIVMPQSGDQEAVFLAKRHVWFPVPTEIEEPTDA